MSSRQCNQSGRSFTDILSNAVFLSPLKSSAELSALLRRHLESQKLTELMHEAVHHQSLMSPVGHAWCLLGFGFQRSGWAMNERSDQLLVNEFTGRYMRFLATTIALRPIAEGLALFAEYDVVPNTGDGPRSLVASLAEIIGTGFYPEAIREPILHTKLFMSRQAHHANKKADLLAGPMTALSGGYLTGYLIVKAIWHQAIVRDQFFASADNFLTFALGLFYGDCGLAAIILANDVSEKVFPNQIAADVSSRALQTLTGFCNDVRLAKRREQIMAEPQSFPTTSVPIDSISGLGASASNPLTDIVCTPTEIAEADRLLSEWLKNQMDQEPTLSVDRSTELKATQARMWNGRQYLRLLSLKVKWSLGPEGVVDLVGESFAFTAHVKGFDSDQASHGEGFIEIAFSLQMLAYGVFLTSGMSVGIMPEYSLIVNREDLDRVLRGYESSVDVRRRDEQLAVWLDDTRECVMSREMWSKTEAEIISAATKRYLTHLLSSSPDQANSVSINDIGRDGLFVVFDEGQAIRDLAICSIVATVSPTPEQFELGIASYNLNMHRVKSLNENYATVFGWDAIEVGGTRVSSRV